ncbi:hypothetical protein WG66_004063 [Moniliophthora roreri]|nr:hypothetical protein WG66_004063 [Moniliophthora roreri]
MMGTLDIDSLLEDPIQLCRESCPFTIPNLAAIPRIIQYVQQNPGNYICPDDERSMIETFIGEAEVELSACDTVLNSLRSVLAQLDRRRAALCVLKKRVEGISRSLIRTLPPELLLRIFLMCESPTAKPLGHHAAQPSCHIILILSHVCARWRSLALSEPTLWTNIRVHFTACRERADAQRVLAFTEFCLEKSQTQPLCIDFNTLTLSPRPLLGVDDHALAEIVKHGSRWKHATLKLPHRTIRFPSTMPLLESLTIIGDSTYTSRDIEVSADPVSTPRLRSLQDAVLHNRIFWRLDTRALVRLSTHEHRIHAILEILTRLPGLQELLLCSPIRHGRNDPIPPKVTSHLRVLEIQIITGWCDIFFDSVTLPSLMCLRILKMWTHLIPFPQALVQFLRQSQPPVAELCIRNTRMSSQHLILIIDLLPSVFTFDFDLDVLDEGVINETLIQKLTISTNPNANSVTLLPNLTNLILRPKPNFSAFDADQLCEMVRSRRVATIGVKQLESFTLYSRPQDLDDRVRKGLEKLRDNGLVVDIIDWDGDSTNVHVL